MIHPLDTTWGLTHTCGLFKNSDKNKQMHEYNFL